MNVDRRPTPLAEGVGQIGAPIAIQVGRYPLLGIPEATLLCGPTLHPPEAASRRRPYVDRCGAGVIEDVREIGGTVAVEVAREPFLRIPEHRPLGRPALRPVEAAAGR